MTFFRLYIQQRAGVKSPVLFNGIRKYHVAIVIVIAIRYLIFPLQTLYVSVLGEIGRLYPAGVVVQLTVPSVLLVS